MVLRAGTELLINILEINEKVPRLKTDDLFRYTRQSLESIRKL